MLFSSVVFVTAFALSLVHGRIRASKNLHQGLLHRILRSPMSFFDTTPLGRIVNRFSSDVSTVDTLVPAHIEFWLYCSFTVIATLITVRGKKLEKTNFPNLCFKSDTNKINFVTFHR